MKLFIKVKTKAKNEFVKRLNDNNYIISVKEPPVQGKANWAVIEALARYFDIKKSNIKIISGLTSKQKTIEIF